MNNSNNIPQEIIDKATRLCSIKGNTKTIEQRISELMADAAKKAKKHSKEAKWNQRELVNNTKAMTGEELENFNEEQRKKQYRAAGLI